LQTVIEGGIIKPRGLQSKKALEVSSRATLLHDSEPPVATLAKQTKAVKGHHEVEYLLEDASTSSISLAEGVTARPMEYGQKYVNGNGYVLFDVKIMAAETTLVPDTMPTPFLWTVY
jgi:hypothetical protein